MNLQENAPPSTQLTGYSHGEWMSFRSRMMLDPGAINLNTGSFGPTPWEVFQQSQEYRRQLAAQPMDFFLRQSPKYLASNRKRLAQFLHCDPSTLVFMANVSLAMNLVIQSVPRLLTPGLSPDSVEILITDLEYGSLVWAWEKLCAEKGYRLRKVTLPRRPKDPGEIVEAIQKDITPQTRILYFSHVTSPTGMVLPAGELCDLARKHHLISIVDGAHAPAFVPVDLKQIGADFYGANCHKWLLAPMGCGFLQATQEGLEKLDPLWISWGYKSAENLGPHDEDGLGSTPSIRRLEFAGSIDPCAWLGVSSAIDFHEEIGPDLIRQRQAKLIGKVRDTVYQVAHLVEHTPPPGLMGGGMAAFQLPWRSSSQPLRDYLWNRHRMEVNFIERLGEDLLIRFSTHFYNTETEIDCIKPALADLLHWIKSRS